MAKIEKHDTNVETIRVKIGPGGRIVIPAKFRDAMGVAPGDEVVLCLDDGQMRVYTQDWIIRRARRQVSGYVPPDVSLVDDLIQTRRAEAAREEAVAADWLAKNASSKNAAE